MRRKTRRGGAITKPPMHGIGAMDSATFLYIDPAPLPGNAAGFWVAYIARAVTAVANEYYFSSSSGSAGWAFITDGSARIDFQVANGVGTMVRSPALAVSSGMVYAVVGVFDGTKARGYVNGVQNGDGSAVTGYTVSSTALYFGGGSPGLDNLDFFGAAYGLGAPSSQNILDWYCQVRTQRRIVDMPGTPASRLWRPTAGAADMTDLIGGSVTLSKVGAGHTALALTSPNWG